MGKLRYCLSALAGITLLLTSCEDTVIKEPVYLPSLNASELFRADSIYSFIGKCTEEHRKLSADYLKRSEEVAGKDNAKCIYYLKRSISLHPELEKYVKLGDAMLRDKRFADAQQLFQFVGHRMYIDVGDKKYRDTFLLGKPNEDIYYKMMLSEVLDHNMIWGESFWAAEDAGMDMNKIRERLLGDPLFPFTANSRAAQNIKVQFMSEEEIEKYKTSPEGFAFFLSSFKDSLEVFDLKGEQLYAFKYHQDDMADYEFMDRPAAEYLNVHYTWEKQENPDSWIRYDLKTRYRLNKDVWVAVYALDSSATACPPDMRHVFHELVTYTNSGQVIDHKVIAAQNGESKMEASVKKSKITVYTYLRHWEQPYDKNNFENSLKSEESTGSFEIFIKDDGYIVAPDLEL